MLEYREGESGLWIFDSGRKHPSLQELIYFVDVGDAVACAETDSGGVYAVQVDNCEGLRFQSCRFRTRKSAMAELAEWITDIETGEVMFDKMTRCCTPDMSPMQRQVLMSISKAFHACRAIFVTVPAQSSCNRLSIASARKANIGIGILIEDPRA
jgi:hypothetical protein